MKKLFVSVLLSAQLAFGQVLVNVQKASGTNVVSGNLTVGANTTLTIASGANIVAAVGSNVSGFGGGGASYTFTVPLVNTGNVITIDNAAADGSTKGAATFAAADFNASSGLITIDYANATTANATTKGFLAAADWVTFNAKAPTVSPTFTGTPVAPTASLGDNTTQLATTAFVANGLANLSSSLSTTFSSASSLTSGTLGTARLPAFSGDITTSAGSAVTTLATVNSNPGTFGNATLVPQITVDAKGRITAVSNVVISGGGGGGTGNVTNNASLTNNAVILGNGTTGIGPSTLTYNATNLTYVFGASGVANITANVVNAQTAAFTTMNITTLNTTTPVGVAAGGTGVSTITQNGIMIGNATNGITTLVGGTTNNVVTWNGTAWVSAAPQGGGGGSGNVTAANAFGTDNILIRSDGTGRGVQGSNITVSDTDNLSGIVTLTANSLVTTNLTVGSKNLTLAGNLTVGGTSNLTLTTGATTNATFPTGTITLVELSSPQTLSNKTVNGVTMTGVSTISGASVITANTISGNVIDVTLPFNTLSITANNTFTFSGTPANSNQWFSAVITADSSAHTITIPSSKQAGSLSTVTSVTVPANGQVHLTWRYDGTNYIVYGTEGLSVSNTAFASSWDGDTGTAPSKNAVYDIFGDKVNYPLSVYAAGTAYSLTSSAAALDFGTTDPALTIDKPGTYLIFGRASLKYNAATFAANQSATIKLRRTNNTAADLTNGSTTATLRVITTITDSVGVLSLAPVIYSTTNSDDAIALYGSLSATPSAGSVDATEASIVVIKLF